MYPVAFFSKPQTVLYSVYRPVTRWLLFCLKNFAGIDYKILNLSKIPAAPIIVGCNHQSTWETFVFSLLFDKLAIVIKKELLQIPIAGLYFKRLGCIPIDRASPVSAIKTLLRFGKEAYQKRNNILIFPNGTRGGVDEQIEYKSGIFALYKTLGIPVIPVKINSGKFWPRRSFRKIPGSITLDFKEPISAGLTKEEFFTKFEREMNE
jgi:1-acyl-sn-glycerol-3-phosphate acyltransferase